MVKKRIIVLLAILLIMGLSLLAIQCDPGSSKQPAKGMHRSIPTELKSPLKGCY
jgi:hypothetical protein